MDQPEQIECSPNKSPSTTTCSSSTADFDYAVVMEGSLKLKEISYIHFEAYAAGELKNGTLALIEEGIPVITLGTQEHLMEKTISNIKEVKARGAHVLGKADDQLYTIRRPPLLTSALSVTPLQLLAYYASGNGERAPLYFFMKTFE